MLSEIDPKLEQSQIQWDLCLVKVHQDDQVGPLDKCASLNLECDTAANQRLAQDQDNP